MKLIFDSGKFWDFKFLKIEILKKGGGKGGGQVPGYETLQQLCKKSDFLPKKRLSDARMMLCMVGTNVLEWCPPFRPPFSCPPFCTPFHLHVSSMKNVKFSPFLNISSWFGGTQRALPPLFAPLFYIWKVPTICYKFCIYDFRQKCFVFCVQTHFLKTNQLLAYESEWKGVWAWVFFHMFRFFGKVFVCTCRMDMN